MIDQTQEKRFWKMLGRKKGRKGRKGRNKPHEKGTVRKKKVYCRGKRIGRTGQSYPENGGRNYFNLRKKDRPLT